MTIIVTRHQGLVDFLKEEGIEGRVVTHAKVEDVKGQDVIGVLPLSLASEANSVTEVVMTLPFDKRGAELSKDDVRQYASGLQSYKVVKI